MAAEASGNGKSQARRAIYRNLPGEGDDGLYSQSWYPICLSTEVPQGKALSKPFLGGKVLVYRGEDGVARVMSGYCLHLGADLGLGTVDGNRIRCPFHKWEYGPDGACVRTGCGDPVPKGASLFQFPSQERWGLVWAFNGEQATWDLPSFRYPDADLYIESGAFGEFNVDPWVVMCNTPDVQHIELLHGVRMEPVTPADYRWTEHGFRFDLRGVHWMERVFDWTAGIDGTNIFFQDGPLDGRYFGFMTPMSVMRPQRSMVYYTVAVLRGDDTPAARASAQRWAREVYQLEVDFASQDMEIFTRSRFRQGILTAQDLGLAKFMEYLRAFPRANPAVEFIT
jgi:phenylpropionate dioxygenase-like ring-hydroxylating dioxygenase large terminal subunit